MEAFVRDEWRTLGPGEKAVVPPGVPHTVRALADQVHRRAQSRLEYEEFFRHPHRLVSTGAIQMPPRARGPRSTQ